MNRWWMNWIPAVAAVVLLTAEGGQDRPNVIWITSEDNSPRLGCYGDAAAKTPNIDDLARRGVRYTHAFANTPVCAPARSTLLMGTTAQQLGTLQMRSTFKVPAAFHPYIELLKEAGYYCSNRSKNDFNMADAGKVEALWDSNDADSSWRGRKTGQPFFSIFNIGVCHESAQARLRGYKPTQAELDAVVVPPYLMDNKATRMEWAKYYKSINDMDREAGEVLRQLEEDGLAEDTIVFYYADHGGPFLRGKRYLYESGTLVPMIISFPEKYRHLAPAGAGKTCDRMVAFVDFAPTLLSLLDIPVPENMEGIPFLGKQNGPEKEVIYLARGRMDRRIDLIRGVRDRQYRYIRNYMPHRPIWQHLTYPANLFPSLYVWEDAYKNGECNEYQRAFWEPKAVEELYDVTKDPHEIHNLAGDPAFADVLERMRTLNRQRIREIKDPTFVPEGQLPTTVPPYDYVRQNGFPIEAVIEMAELASLGDKKNLPALRAGLSNPEKAIRFWAATGCVILGADAAPLKKELILLLSDSDDEVRIASAEALVKLGELDRTMPMLLDILQNGNETSFNAAFNIIDFLPAEQMKPYLDQFASVKPKDIRTWKLLNHVRGRYELEPFDFDAAKRAQNK